MTRPNIKLSHAVMHVLGAGMAATLAAGPASAQQAQKVEKIEVTGSNIKRVEGESALPVTVRSRLSARARNAAMASSMAARRSSCCWSARCSCSAWRPAAAITRTATR